MSRTVTIGEIRDAVRTLADIENSAFITNAMANQWIDDAYCELTDTLIAADIHLFDAEVNIVTDGLTDLYDLPSDHYKTLAVDYQWSTDQWRPLELINFANRTRYRISPGFAVGYRLTGYKIQLYPKPPVGTYRHTYVPAPAKTVGLPDDTEVEGFAGWDRYIVAAVCRKCAVKSNEDTSQFDAEIAAQRARIQEMALDRQQPTKIADTRGRRGIRDWRNVNWLY